MGYKPPLEKTEHLAIYEHNRAQIIAPGNVFTVKYADDENATTQDVLKNADAGKIRGIFSDLVNTDILAPSDNNGPFILFHAVNPDDNFNLTNSKLPELHFHVITGALADESQHVEQKKTYVPNPVANLASIIDAQIQNEPSDRFITIDLGATNEGEAAKHIVLTHKGFTNLKDFASHGTDQDMTEFRDNLSDIVTDFTAEGEGGARIIIDERFHKDSQFSVHLIGGENLGQEPDKKHRWFQDPAAPPKP